MKQPLILRDRIEPTEMDISIRELLKTFEETRDIYGNYAKYMELFEGKFYEKSEQEKIK
jgi:hypothetical protein